MEMTAEASQPRDPRALRVSDADREQVVDELREAVAEGRLEMDEFEERLEQAYRARVHDDLASLTSDLPVRRGSAVARRQGGGPVTDWASRIGGRRTSSGAVGFLGGSAAPDAGPWGAASGPSRSGAAVRSTCGTPTSKAGRPWCAASRSWEACRSSSRRE
ncbi:hypothetical protein SHKM778_32220 [Streptomyces sp. KM77-8]|uniref:DUF1707 domain-containing protein n=1 Tax=Streptomyces haneummycinicus TaxID=3074435 RepID=A0AAT9HHF1_9ACTN